MCLRNPAQVAKSELRQLRQNAREGTRLLEDKKVLESKCQELQATLEVVQNQRNELRHQVCGEDGCGCEWGMGAAGHAGGGTEPAPQAKPLCVRKRGGELIYDWIGPVSTLRLCGLG
eukprot:scaffold266375_cov21-Tisochrysis_lutea.AAC.1